jgi:hypothetical protein
MMTSENVRDIEIINRENEILRPKSGNITNVTASNSQQGIYFIFYF